MEFEWVEGFVDGSHIDASQCGERIMLMWNKKHSLNKEDIVVDALDAESPFRDLIFKDSDEDAAMKHRLSLAGDLLRHINVISYTSDGRKVSVRLVEKLTIILKPSKDGAPISRNTFVPINVIVNTPSLLDQLFSSIDCTIDEYANKRSRLKEYASTKPHVLKALSARDQRMAAIISG